MKNRPPFHLLGAIAGLVLTSVSTHAAQVYLETFTQTNGDKPLTAVGWSVLVTESGTISNYGTQSRAIGINGTNDYAFYAPKADDSTPTWTAAVVNDPAMAFTTVPGPINIANLTSIGWTSQADNSDGVFRVAIKLGGVWYASSTTLTDGAPEIPAVYTPLSYNPASFATASNWLAIQNTTVGNSGTLSLGAAPGSDLSGNVTAFGLYLVAGSAQEAGDHIRFDNFEINAVPEPSTALLGLFASLGFISRRRRN